CKALICDAAMPNIVGVAMLKTAAARRDQVAQVSTKIPWKSPVENARFHVVAVDCGIKHNIIRSLNRRGCDVTVVPWNISANELEVLRPDGVFLSNGPGNPEDAKPVIELVRQLRGRYPIFGICLGHQIIALSYGAKTYRLKFGHRGGNHPVKNLLTGKVEITSQNHSYAVNGKSLDGTGLEVTHVNLLDNTVEGLRSEKDRVFSVQYHPESAPGPQDSAYLFDEFIRAMEGTSHA
ncbi:MAG: carbamoyl phosphate synthase small subunit, partial [Oscillospiraceae bacterium]|nr:carbamoyl phosphate synthase small subunit [Oscillospiraceae bacterium]